MDIGWQVTAEDGTLLDSGPITEAHLVAALAEFFGADTQEGS